MYKQREREREVNMVAKPKKDDDSDITHPRGKNLVDRWNIIGGPYSQKTLKVPLFSPYHSQLASTTPSFFAIMGIGPHVYIHSWNAWPSISLSKCFYFFFPSFNMQKYFQNGQINLKINVFILLLGIRIRIWIAN